MARPITRLARLWAGREQNPMMKRPTRRELFTVPNLLSYFRLLLIPVFVWLYLHAQDTRDFTRAAIVIGVSGLTDLFDGKLARRLGQVTELGVLLDPVADKLTEGAVIFCLFTRYRLVAVLIAVYLLKEGYMTVAGLVMLRRGKKLGGAMWFGKVCTFVFYLVVLALVLWVDIPQGLANLLILVCTAMMLFTFVMYARVYFRMGRDELP